MGRARVLKSLVATSALLTLMLLSAAPAVALEPAGDGWFWQEPQPASGWFNDVASAGPFSAWVVGDSGLILHTGDAGTTWHTQLSGTTADLVAIDAVDSLTAFIAATRLRWSQDLPAVVLRTTDGGATWQRTEVAGDPGFDPRAIRFVDALRGWIGGVIPGSHRTAVFTTQDGGQSWQRQPLSTFGEVKCLEFWDDQRGWAGTSESAVFRTEDGGTTWAKTRMDGLWDVQRLAATSATELWVLADDESRLFGNSKLFKSRDGGRTLAPHVPGLGRADRASELKVDESGAVILGGDCGLWYTTDDGATWVKRRDIFDLRCFAGSPSATLFATNDEDMRVSSDGGRLWPSAIGGLDLDLVHDVEALAGHQGWMLASAYRTKVYRCEDGARWVPMRNAPWAEQLEFADLDHGFVTGLSGRVLWTADAGASWSMSALGDDYRMTAAQMLDAATAWVTGHDESRARTSLWRTTDGGLTWRRAGLPGAFHPTALRFVDETHGWVAGGGAPWGYHDGRVLRTTDGGATWVDASGLRTDSKIWDIEFVDRQKGWIAAGDEGLLRTDDGGASWREESGAELEYADYIEFRDVLHGFAGGPSYSADDVGPSSRTDDGGATWTRESVPGGRLSIAADGSALAAAHVGGELFSNWDVAEDVVAPNTVAERPSFARNHDGRYWLNHDVTLRMASLDPGGSGVARQEYAVDQRATWTPAAEIFVPAPADHSNDGKHNVHYRAVDNAGNVGEDAWLPLMIDTRGPTTRVSQAVVVRRGVQARIMCRVDDALSPAARVMVKVLDVGDASRMTLSLGYRPTGKTLTCSFRCWLPKGRYTIEVRAIDFAGNAQRVAGRNALRVL